MKQGEERQVIIPGHEGYGAGGFTHAGGVAEWLLTRVLGRPELLPRLLHDAGRMHGHLGALGHLPATALLQDVVDSAVASWRRGARRHGVSTWRITRCS